MIRAAVLITLFAVLAACQSAPTTAPTQDGVAVLQRVNDTAQRCWRRSGDPAFEDFRIVPELDTRVGRPRILLLSAGRTSGLPQLVIETGNGSIDAYGPVQDTPLAGRVNADILRWANGDTACTR